MYRCDYYDYYNQVHGTKGNVIMTQKTFDGQTATFLSKLITSFPANLTGEEMQKCIDDPKGLRDAIHEYLHPIRAKVWKTVTFSAGLRTAEDYRKSFKKMGVRVSECTSDVIGRSTFTTFPYNMEVELVVASVAELGFKESTTRKEIYVRAMERGLGLCPTEVALQLRQEYIYQPKIERLFIAMNPIIGWDSDQYWFNLGRDASGELWLDVWHGVSDDVWDLDRKFVFLRPNSGKNVR
jgi:hypothetical protein